MRARLLPILLIAVLSLASGLEAQKLEIPRRHDRPPGPPLSAEDAVQKMTVPEGFSVEIVAAEPDVVNPVAMCIDEKGRFWITESIEYPRKEPGPGQDRVKVLEDTDGDGKVDKVTVFADGLNIPSGIAVGYGGVWVANSPDILFLQDTDGDLKADKTDVVVTGFGRTDTHELPNSLTWGPDGWLYGLNGVFNYSDVKYGLTNPNFKADHPGWKFTCAMFRIHPRTRKFEVFAEGTSNPWGIAFNDEGEAFISACVIDHLWHIVETGYYIRQGGPYPPHTWPMRSIVDHKHQKAAYCGITWFDSDAYPEEYRNVLYMGNIHGGCINADIVERSGATYKGRPHPGFPPKPGAWDDDEYGSIAKTGDESNPKLADFLTANDPWFMPVVQTTGPDGCLYILDWYDRYHCYQDANADPEGIERAKGRLYRVVYQGHQHRKADDLSEAADDELVTLLNAPNGYLRETSRRLLAERLSSHPNARVVTALTDVMDRFDDGTTQQQKLQALWTLGSAGLMTEDLFSAASAEDQPSAVRSWATRLAADQLNPADLFEGWGFLHALNADPTVKLSILAGIGKAESEVATKASLLWLAVLGHDQEPLIQHVAWQNLLPLLREDPNAVLATITGGMDDRQSLGALFELLPRLVAVVAEHPETSAEQLCNVFTFAFNDQRISSTVKQRMIVALSDALRQRALDESQIDGLRKQLAPLVTAAREGSDEPLSRRATILHALLGDGGALADVRGLYQDSSRGEGERMAALETLVAAQDASTLTLIDASLRDPNTSQSLRVALIDVLSSVNDPAVASILLGGYAALPANARPKAVEVLTQRPEWSLELLKAIDGGLIDKAVVNLNQLKRVSLFKNEALQALVTKTYGSVRQEGRSDRQHVINFHRDFLNGTPGDPERGIAAFKKVCGQCHKIYGDGVDVGPDITRNGRNNWEQLLQNVFDPSAVIGPGYQARTLLTVDGRVLTGLPVEESDQRVILKIQGGKVETIPRDQIDEYVVSPMSMMPEDLEKQLTPQEIADLFAFLALDKPPGDPTGKVMSGAPRHGR